MNKSKKVKVCQIASADFTLKFMLKNQLIFLKNQGYEVIGVCSNGKWVEDLQREGIKIKTISFKRKISPLSDLIVFVKLFFYFKKEKFDIVHTHTFKPDFYGQIAAKWARVPIIIRTSHGFPFGEMSSPLKKHFYLFLEKFLNAYSDLILSIGRHIIDVSIKEKIARPEKIKYLGRDINTGRFNPDRFSEDFIVKNKEKLGISANKKIVGIVARLVEEKGYLELFEAFKKVIAEFPEAILLVVGPSEPEKKDAINPNIVVNYGIEKNVLFLGERPDVDEIYPLMDIFVLPTHMEGLGASILEASASKRPVIASNTGGVPETIENRKTGILVPVKNPAKLAEAIIYLLKNPEIAKKMGKEGREKVVNEFATEIILKRLGNEYKQIIERKLKSFDERWFSKYNEIAKKEGAKEYEISYWSEKGLKNYVKYFIEYFNSYIKNKGRNSEIRVLDVGCGPGVFSRFLSGKGFKVFGVDYSEDIINIAKDKSLNENIEFKTGNLYNLPYANGFFDIAVCSGVFQCISDYQKALSEINRVLKPGGVAIVMTLNKFSLTNFLQKQELKRYNPYQLKREIAKYGFHKIKIKGIYFLPGPLDFLVSLLIKSKIYKFSNLFFPFFMFFSHSFYIEGKKLGVNSKKRQ